MTTTDSRKPVELDADELRARVLYALLLPAVRLARVFSVPLRGAGDWLQMAYFHELKRAGFRMQPIAELLDVSMRKVALLSSRLKDGFTRTRAVELSRRIEFMLSIEPLSRARIGQVLPGESPPAIDAAIDELCREGRIVLRRSGRNAVYEPTKSNARLVESDMASRFDALNNFLGNVCDVVFCRFFAPGEPGFVRTVSFQIREADLHRLRALYESAIWPLIQELEGNAATDPAAACLTLSLCWAPHERLHPERFHSTKSAGDL